MALVVLWFYREIKEKEVETVVNVLCCSVCGGSGETVDESCRWVVEGGR